MNKHLEAFISNAKKIEIVSGEGESGSVSPYTGKKNLAALKRKLKSERAGGDRWAFAKIDGAKVEV